MTLSRRPARRPGRRAPLVALCALGAGALLAACSNGSATDCVTGVDAGCEQKTTARAPEVGQVLSLNVQTEEACASAIPRGARVAAVSNRAIVVHDTTNPANGFTNAEYASIAQAFDSLVYPVDVRHFGEPTDRDNNGRVIIFYTRAVNELTPAGETFIVGGFFWNRDIFPKTASNPRSACAGSNDGELFYMLAPDPSGAVNGNRRTKDYVAGSTVGVLAHEFQHLISATRRLYVTRTAEFDEETWLNEGLSHIAEELTFYRAGGLSATGSSPKSDLALTDVNAPRSRLTALNNYNFQNLSRFSRYLRTVETSSPYAGDDSLSTRGAAWAFLRYAADRSGSGDETFFNRLVNSNEVGLANLRTVSGAGANLPDWFRDWTVANYADGLVAPTLEARLTHPSWQFRSVLPALPSNDSRYPLATRSLSPNGQAETASIVGGTSAYFAFAVGPGAQATVRTRAAGGGPLSATARVSLVRVTVPDTPGGPAVTTYDAGAGGDVTVTNTGINPAQYALVVFNASTNPVARQDVSVALTSTGAAVLASAAAGQPGPTRARLAVEGEGPALTISDARINARLRAISRRELRGRVAGARAEYEARRRRD